VVLLVDVGRLNGNRHFKGRWRCLGVHGDRKGGTPRKRIEPGRIGSRRARS
jgi:hypothetical protein